MYLQCIEFTSLRYMPSNRTARSFGTCFYLFLFYVSTYIACIYLPRVYLVLLEVRRGWIPVTRVMYDSELPRGCWEPCRCSGRAVSAFNRYLSSSSCGLSVCDFLRSCRVSTLAILTYSPAVLWLFSFHPSRNFFSFIFLVIAILAGGDSALCFKLVSPQLLVVLGSLPYKVHQMHVICREMSTRFIVRL